MDALQQAQRAAQNADVLNRPNDPLQELEFAKMYAAIAQAEQLKRIGDCLNAMASTLAGIEAAHFEANVLRKEITTDVKREFSPDPQDYQSEAAYMEALDKYNDWRAQIEYGQDAGGHDEIAEDLLDTRQRAREWFDGTRRGMGLDTDAEGEARTDYADPLN